MFLLCNHLAAELLTVTKASQDTATLQLTQGYPGAFAVLFSFAAAGFGGFGGGGSVSQAQAQAQAQSFSQGADTHQQGLHLLAGVHSVYVCCKLACLEPRPLADCCIQAAQSAV